VTHRAALASAATTYLLLRSLFVYRTRVAREFNFAHFIKVTMQEDLVSIMGLDWYWPLSRLRLACTAFRGARTFFSML
jgi:hypothetical protein